MKSIYDVLIVGTGAAAYNCALHLFSRGVTHIAIISENRMAGTSRNAGSDKQTYYKAAIAGERVRLVETGPHDRLATRGGVPTASVRVEDGELRSHGACRPARVPHGRPAASPQQRQSRVYQRISTNVPDGGGAGMS